MREAPTILVAVLCSVSQPARAQTWVVSDGESEDVCRSVSAELEQIGVVPAGPKTESIRRSRRKAFADPDIVALAACLSSPARIEVYYPDGSRLGAEAFVVSADEEASTAAVYVSERIRAERFIADVPVATPFAPAVWWLGLGADALFSPGGIAPLAFITVDVGYRFHRHWSFGGFVSVQPYMRRLDAGALQTRVRLDQFGVALSYHLLVTERVDLSLGARVAATRLGANGRSTDQTTVLQSQRDAAWLAFPAGRLAIRVGLARMFWLRLQGELGALVPRAVVSAGPNQLGSIGELAGQAGLGLEVHFR